MKARTRPGRLRALDAWLVDNESHLLAASGDAPVLDLGFGEEPVTTVELFEALNAVNPKLSVIGIEADADRALNAAKQDRPGLRFVKGDFALLPLLPKARVIRLMNVLRAGPEDATAHAKLGAALIDGGLALEGSSDPEGDILTANLLRRRGDKLEREGLLLYTAFTNGFAPLQFRDWLPRDLRRRVKPGEPIHTFFETWTKAWNEVRTEDPKESFKASVAKLGGDEHQAAKGYFLLTLEHRPARSP